LHDAASLVAGATPNEIEPDLFRFPDHESRAEQHDPDPQGDADLVRPADRKVEEVAEYDLENEHDEHREQHRAQNVLRPPSEPVAGGCQSFIHSVIPPLRERAASPARPVCETVSNVKNYIAAILSRMPSGQDLAR